MIFTLEAASEALLEARLQRRGIDPPSTAFSGFDLGQAYEVGAELDRRLEARGYKRAGFKVGFTNKAIWPTFGLDQPILAPVYEQTLLDSADPISLAPYFAPKLELEVVFGMGPNLVDIADSAGPAEGPNRGLSPEWVALGFEIVDCHYPNWHLSPADSVADFGLHGALVVGPRLGADSPGFEQIVEGLDDLQVTLSRADGHVESGFGRNVMGHPLNALEVVPRLLAPYDNVARTPAQYVVSTGTMTGLAPLSPGDRWRAEAVGGELAGLEIHLTV